jgi:lipoyl(octanoyl) transferase
MTPVIRWLGRVDYRESYARMRAFTEARAAGTADEIWLLEHPPVYTLGLNARREHLLDCRQIPVIATDRGGQVTYHGPGQLLVYLLLDLDRLGFRVRALVRCLEQAVIDYLRSCGLDGARRPGAPGVYIGGAKIAALGLRIRNGACYHGLALNVDLDLEPFSGIHPCGYPDLAVTRLRDFGIDRGVAEVAEEFLPFLLEQLGSNSWAASSSSASKLVANQLSEARGCAR